jgi:hypothetical protein
MCSSIAATKARFRFAPGASGRCSSTALCMLRTTYQRGSAVGSNGSYTDRRGDQISQEGGAPSAPRAVHSMVIERRLPGSDEKPARNGSVGCSG